MKTNRRSEALAKTELAEKPYSQWIPRLPPYIGLVFTSMILLYWISQSVSFPPHDFSNSYFGAHYFLDGRFDPSIYDPYTFNTMIYADGFRNIFASYNPNPPSAAIIFIPFAWLPLFHAKILFNFLTAALFVATLIRLSRHFHVNDNLVLTVLPFLFFIPIRNQVLFGQTYFLLFTLLVEGYLTWLRKRYTISSALWAAAIFLKVFPAIIFLLLFIRKDWKAIWILAAFCVSFLLACILIQGPEVWLTYAFELLPRSGRGEITGEYVVNYQSAWMLFKLLFVADPALNPNPFYDSEFAFKALYVLFTSFVLTMSVAIFRNTDGPIAFSALLVAALLVSPYGSTYSCILLLPVLIAAPRERASTVAFAAVILGLASNVPLQMVSGWVPPFNFPRLLLVVTLLIVLMVLSGAKYSWMPALAFVCIFAATTVVDGSNIEDNSFVYPENQRHSLIFDYEVVNGRLVYRYWSDDGPQLFQTDLLANSISHERTRIHNNQIYFNNTRITDSPDRKMKASLLNDSTIIFLSDRGRGPGFYRLRAIRVH